MIQKIFCKLGYHKYTYDSASQPCYCKCTKCNKRWHLELNSEYCPIKEPHLYQQWKEVK